MDAFLSDQPGVNVTTAAPDRLSIMREAELPSRRSGSRALEVGGVRRVVNRIKVIARPPPPWSGATARRPTVTV